VDRQLEGIKRRIEREKRGITEVRKKEGSVLQRLEKIEEDLDRKNRELKEINSRLESLLADLQKKEEQVEKIGASIKARRVFLQRRARALYKWQRGGSPFVLLSGGLSVAELVRRKRYLELMLAYDQELVGSLSRESEREKALKGTLASQREELDGERKALVQVKERIRLEGEKKKELLSSLRREKEAHASVLKELEQAAQRLQKMMDEMSRKTATGSSPVRSGFERVRGRLDYPVRGEVVAGFGKTRHPEFSSELFRKGIDIEAPLGEEIRAVEGGRVVFADRFSGYGKMMIIDHGERYYTVYAHLADVLKKTGEGVQKGEPIGLVGDSDSLSGARLYFEIRKDGKPVDPLPWFKRR
jgi:septal ring factor EnvC (AmiA/AmiB activator)